MNSLYTFSFFDKSNGGYSSEQGQICSVGDSFICMLLQLLLFYFPGREEGGEQGKYSGIVGPARWDVNRGVFPLVQDVPQGTSVWVPLGWGWSI